MKAYKKEVELRSLMKSIHRGDMILDEKGVEYKQIFVEFFLLGLPLPNIFILEDKDGYYIVKDRQGKEILYSALSFMKGERILEESSLLRMGFEDFSEKTWHDLEPYQRRNFKGQSVGIGIYFNFNPDLVQEILARLNLT